MGTMEFMECCEEELKNIIEENDLTLSWKMTFEPMKIMINGETVGLIDCSLAEVYEKNAIQIESFEVFKKERGIGSKIINEFLEEARGSKVYLYSDSHRCESFWEKHGFIAIDDGTGTKIYRCDN